MACPRWAAPHVRCGRFRTRFRGRLKVAQTSGIGRDQRGGAVPVFRGVVYVKQFGDYPKRASTIQDGALDLGRRIARRGGREGEEVGRIDMVFEDTEMSGRH